MTISIISFTQKGIQLSEKIAQKLEGTESLLYTKCSLYDKENPDIRFVDEKITQWAGHQMQENNVLLFIGACQIAVRAVAPHITDKLHDSPVLVADEKGRYVIPILAGHIGGANELALVIAQTIGAEAVITTATDVNRQFAVDLFAKKNELFLVNKEGIAKVSSKVLAGQTVTIAIETGHVQQNTCWPQQLRRAGYPPIQPVDIVVSSEERPFDAAILLKPREYVIGMGCKKNKEADKIAAFIRQSLEEAGIADTQIAALASVVLKSKEPGLLAWSRQQNIAFITYTAEELQEVTGDFQGSDFVREKTGVDNVCERAALKAAGKDAVLVYQKHAQDGMTVAVAKRKWSVGFYEL